MLIRYILRRLLIAIPTLLVISLIIFLVIQLPPGNFLDYRLEQMQKEGQVDPAEIQALHDRYHFDEPILVRYVYWMRGFVTGDLGKSFETDAEVTQILADLLPPTIAISVCSILLTWIVAFPFGIIAATRRNTGWDYSLTFLGLVAMATPPFILALVFQVVMQHFSPNFDPTGLVSQQYQGHPWSFGKVLDLLMHLWVPVVILGVAGTASMIRILRANLIDELKKQYVLCAMARGVHPVVAILRYPLRVAINPFISSIGLLLPALIGGSMIIEIVLGLPTLGPRLLQALQSQDVYLASSCIFIHCILTVVGILISDVLLSLVDPRIRFGGK